MIDTHVGTKHGRERVRRLRHARGCRRRRLRHRRLWAKAEASAACVAEMEEWLAEWPGEWELRFEATVRWHPTLTAPWCLVDEVPNVPTGDHHLEGVKTLVRRLCGFNPPNL